MIDATQWKTLSKQVKESPDLPDWACELCNKSFAEVNDQAEVSLETKVVDNSFIEFLEEQIALNARGEEWTAILKRRKDALYPSVGSELSFLSVASGDHVLWVRFDPESSKVVLVEAHGTTQGHR